MLAGKEHRAYSLSVSFLRLAILLSAGTHGRLDAYKKKKRKEKQTKDT